MPGPYVALVPFRKIGVPLGVQAWMQHVALGPYHHYCSLICGCDSERYNKDTGFSAVVTMWVPITSALDWILC